MSGVTGAERVRSREDFEQFLSSFYKIISKFPNFISMRPSGSYISDLNKQDFGDIDIIVHINTSSDKPATKKELQSFLLKLPNTTIVPFTSPKHIGKRSYNAGELISVRYYDDMLGYSVQIDNIVALTYDEAEFKQLFLNMPAEKQGIVLGLVKIAAIETNIAELFENLNIDNVPALDKFQEYEFNLSSAELQLRKITYVPSTFKQASKEIIWTSVNFEDVITLLSPYNLNLGFDALLDQCKNTIQNPRSHSRIKGIFQSMITVKSGEVGTIKGKSKELALDKLQKALTTPNIVFAFGRFQPPTVGHKLLIDAVKHEAALGGADHVIYVSKTQDHKNNPLSIDQKIKYLNQMFPETNFVACNDQVRTPIEAVISLNAHYSKLVMIAGSDRVPVFEKLINDYNGKEYQYDNIQILSAGARDLNSALIDGISGSKMRAAAISNDFTTFRQWLPTTIDDIDATRLLNEVQHGLIKK